MRFLVILDQVEAPQAANPVLGRRLAAALLARGHRVRLLELWNGCDPLPAPPAGAARTALAFADEAYLEQALEGGRRGGTPLLRRLARLAARPDAVLAAVRQFLLHAPRRVTAARAALEKLDAAERYDAVLAVCAPYRAALALESAHIGAKKLLWQLDPYAANRSYNAPGGYAREGALLTAMDAAFVTPTAAADYAPGAPLAPWRDKVHVLGFPLLVPPAPDAVPAAAPVGCVYCGTFYPGLREPDFALRLFTALDAPDWQLTLVGPGWAAFEDAAAPARIALGDRLHTGGAVPRAQAQALEARAAVLLSLGNAVDNQLPSKLFTHFASGKPVLHLAVSDRDPALPYLARYPLALVLQAGDGCGPAVTARLRAWLKAVRGQRLPFAQVAALYPDFTPEGVADAFLRALP